MTVRLAETAGFCMGVKKAVDRVLDVARSQGRVKIYTYGPLIHNPQTVELLERRGVTPINDVSEIPPDEEAVLIIRTHGISPRERKKIKERGIRIIDATCPKVARVQAIIRKYVSRGYSIVIAGDTGHPEVKGLLGFAGGKGVVVENREDLESLPAMQKVALVAQTTQDMDLYAEIADAVKKKYPQSIVLDTICDSTEKRQGDVKDLAASMDAVVIVGGKNSANTKRLADIAEHQGTPTFHVETAEELGNHPLDRYNRIGVSAGASTPNWIIDRVVSDISTRQISSDRTSKKLFKLWIFLVRADIYAAVGAGCLYIAGALLQGSALKANSFFTAAFYVYAMHVLNRFIDKKSNIIGSFREATYIKRESVFIPLAVAALGIALLLTLAQGMKPFLLLAVISALGILYNADLLPGRWPIRSLNDLPGSKNVSMAAAWAIVTTVIPVSEKVFFANAGTVVAFLFVFAVVFIRSVMSDILDMQNDRLMGRETIPIVMGSSRSRQLLKFLWSVLLALLLLSFPLGWATSLSPVLIICLFYILISFKLYDRRAALSRPALLGILETNYIIAGMSALLWLFFSGSGS